MTRNWWRWRHDYAAKEADLQAEIDILKTVTQGMMSTAMTWI